MCPRGKQACFRLARAAHHEGCVARAGDECAAVLGDREAAHLRSLLLLPLLLLPLLLVVLFCAAHLVGVAAQSVYDSAVGDVTTPHRAVPVAA